MDPNPDDRRIDIRQVAEVIIRHLWHRGIVKTKNETLTRRIERWLEGFLLENVPDLPEPAFFIFHGKGHLHKTIEEKLSPEKIYHGIKSKKEYKNENYSYALIDSVFNLIDEIKKNSVAEDLAFIFNLINEGKPTAVEDALAAPNDAQDAGGSDNDKQNNNAADADDNASPGDASRSAQPVEEDRRPQSAPQAAPPAPCEEPVFSVHVFLPWVFKQWRQGTPERARLDAAFFSDVKDILRNAVSEIMDPCPFVTDHINVHSTSFWFRAEDAKNSNLRPAMINLWGIGNKVREKISKREDYQYMRYPYTEKHFEKVRIYMDFDYRCRDIFLAQSLGLVAVNKPKFYKKETAMVTCAAYRAGCQLANLWNADDLIMHGNVTIEGITFVMWKPKVET